MFGLPVRIGQGLALVDRAVKGGPTPPTDRSLSGDSSVVQASNRIAVSQQLIVVVRRGLEHQALGNYVCSGFDRKTQFNLILRKSTSQIELLLNLGSSRGVNAERCNLRIVSRARSLQMEQGQKPVGGQRAEEKTLFALPVVDELTSGTAMYPAGRLPQVV